MLTVEAWVVGGGLRVDVRGTCTGQCHMGDRCQGDKTSVVIDTGRIEMLGFILAVIEGLELCLQEEDRLVELIDH